MNDFKEISPKGRPVARMYLSFMLWFVGRAIQAAAKVDPAVKGEFDDLPEDFAFALAAAPTGPAMVVAKDSSGRVKYMGGSTEKRPIHVKMTFKSMEAMLLLFTFQESTPVSNARDRLFVEGPIPEACAVVRILDIVQVYLLPKPIAKMAIKRYPRWDIKRHVWSRLLVNVRTMIGL
jgi:hypothetical protein